MNGKDGKYFMLAFSGKKGESAKDFTFIPEKFVVFS